MSSDPTMPVIMKNVTVTNTLPKEANFWGEFVNVGPIIKILLPGETYTFGTDGTEDVVYHIGDDQATYHRDDPTTREIQGGTWELQRIHNDPDLGFQLYETGADQNIVLFDIEDKIDE